MELAEATLKPSDSLQQPQQQQQNVDGSAAAEAGLGHEDRLSVCNKLCYAIGGGPSQVSSSIIAFFLQIYLLDIAQISPFHVSLVLFIGKAWGAITDPAAGFFISKSKWTKIGRLMPWMLACTPFTIVSYFFLWYLPPFVTGRVLWYLAFHSLFQALNSEKCFEMKDEVDHFDGSKTFLMKTRNGRQVSRFSSQLFQVPYCALTMFLSTDQKDRDSAIAYRMTVEVLGTLIGAALQGQIVASAHTNDRCRPNVTADIWNFSNGQQNRSSLLVLSHESKVYLIAAGVIGGIYLLGIVIFFFGVTEKVDPYALDSDKTVPFFKGLRLTMKDGPYRRLTASFLLISAAVQVEQSNFVLFCNYAADLHSHFQNLVLIILVAAAVSIPFWQHVLHRFGKKSAAFGISWMIPFTVMLAAIPNPILAYVVAFVSGLSIAASLLLPWSMLPDVVDQFRLQNPHSAGHETIFYSSYVFFTKMSAGIGLGISVFSLEFVGYRSGACKQSSSVVIMLKILIGAVPAILILIGLFILLFYPINEKSRKETKSALEVLRKNNLSTDNLAEKDVNTVV